MRHAISSDSWFFLPHDAMRKCGLCCGPVSVRPSITLVHCIVSRRLKLSSNFFVDPIAPSFWFSDPRRRYPIPRATPSAGAQNTRRWENFCDFRQIAVYLGNSTRYAHGCYETLIGSHRLSIKWWHFQWPPQILNRFSMSRHFWSRIYQDIYGHIRT